MRCKWIAGALAISMFGLSTSARALHEPVAARRGMVVSTSEIASRAGVEVMRQGGNAVDAAVAVALALAVTWPAAGNLGGGGFMMIRRANGDTEVIDYRERAPLAATRDMYLDKEGKVIKGASIVGHRAVAVPGTIAGLELALARHGTKKWAELVRPARELAEKGYPLTHHAVSMQRMFGDNLEKFAESRRIFLPGGKRPDVGDVFVQRDLGDTLRRLEEKGPREFYEGETAQKIAADMKAHGGLITLADLKEYTATLRQPLRGTYRGYEILTMPPPSSGGAILIEMLNLLEKFDIGALGAGSSDALHLLAEVMRRAFADRAEYMGDTDFVKGVPVKGLMSKKYAAELAKTIDRNRATPSVKVRAGAPAKYESMETTHFTIVDAAGNVVTNTYTLNGSYGSGVTAAGTGILLNNEMDDFTSKPGVPNMFGLIQSEANSIAPRKRPLSAMTPTIVMKDGKVVLAVGSPGGPTIITQVLQVLVNTIDFHMNIRQAVEAPRIHHQWMPDEILFSPYGINRDTRANLEKRGHKLADAPKYFGDVQAIAIDANGLRLGACDPNQGGVPAGY